MMADINRVAVVVAVAVGAAIAVVVVVVVVGVVVVAVVLNRRANQIVVLKLDQILCRTSQPKSLCCSPLSRNAMRFGHVIIKVTSIDSIKSMNNPHPFTDPKT